MYFIFHVYNWTLMCVLLISWAFYYRLTRGNTVRLKFRHKITSACRLSASCRERKKDVMIGASLQQVRGSNAELLDNDPSFDAAEKKEV